MVLPKSKEISLDKAVTVGEGGLKLGVYYAFFSNFLCLPFSFKPSSPINNCMQIFYGSAAGYDTIEVENSLNKLPVYYG